MTETSKTPGVWRHPFAPPTLAGVVAWALGLRVAAADLVQWYAERKGELCLFPDTGNYWLLASKIRGGEPYEVVDFGALPRFALRTPGYPLFLAACQAAFGPRVLPVRLVQAALGAGCVWLVAVLAARALPGDRKAVPLVAALLAAFDPYLIANSAFVLSEAVFLPLMLAAQCALAACWGSTARNGVGWAVVAGLASGAAVMVRPSWALFLPAALGAWVVLAGRGRRLPAARGAAVAALAAALVMAPWWARNARLYGRFVPTALWTGASLYDGLNPLATGDSDMRFLASDEFWPLDEETQDAVLRDRALAFARENPGRVFWLACVKAARFWSPWPNAEGFRSPWVAAACAAVSLPVFALTAAGAWACRRDARALALLGLPLAYTFALHLVFVSSMRYRVPVAAPALGFAAVGATSAFRAFRSRGEKPT